MVKARRNISLPLSIQKEIEELPIDFSEFVTNAYLESKYAIEPLEEEINQLENKLNNMKVRLKENKKFRKQMENITDTWELKLLGMLDEQIKRLGGDIEKESNAYKLFINRFKERFKITITERIAKRKLEIYLTKK